MERLFQLVERYCFQGHTHVPGVFTEGFQFYAPEEIDNEYTLGEGKVMINVGSVGQPRDGDPRACYVILDDGRPRRRERRRASRCAEIRRPADRPGPDHVPPAGLRLRDDDPEDLRHPRARTVPGRPAPPGPLSTRTPTGSTPDAGPPPPLAPLSHLAPTAKVFPTMSSEKRLVLSLVLTFGSV